MPNFDCAGEGCGGLFCPCCTPEAVRERYQKESQPLWDRLKKEGAVSMGSKEVDELKEAEARARKWWRNHKLVPPDEVG
jgi:hypothetical protein